MFKKINTKKKGNAFERKVVKLLEKATGITFRRTFGSGAYKSSFEYAHELGDVRCEDPLDFKRFPFIIECKSYKRVSFHSIMSGECQKLDGWISQVSDDIKIRNEVLECKANPLLIFKTNRCPIFFVVPKDSYDCSNEETVTIYKGKWLVSEITSLGHFLKKFIGE